MEKNFLSIEIGQRLRNVRQQRKLSLDELSELTGVSKPMLGQIERGSSNPTVAVLWKIAAGLQVPFASFLGRNPSIKVIPVAEQAQLHEDEDQFEVYNTFASPGIPLEIYRIQLKPGCAHHNEAHGLGVIKILTVHAGTLTITIGGEQTTLYKGDTISFSSDVDHIFENFELEVCECNIAIYYSSPAVQV